MAIQTLSRAARFAAAYLVLIAFAAAPAGRAAEDGIDGEVALLSGDTAFLLDAPQLLVPPGAGSETVTLSPNGHYVVAWGVTPNRFRPFEDLREDRSAAPGAHTLSLYLYDARSERVSAVKKWSEDATRWHSPQQTVWLAGGETAVVDMQTMPSPPESFRHSPDEAAESDAPASSSPDPATQTFDSDLLIIRAAQRSVQTVPVYAGLVAGTSSYLIPSPTRPEALVSYHTDVYRSGAVSLFSERGIIGAPISKDKDDFFSGWNPDGTAALIIHSEFVTDGEHRRSTRSYRLWDRATGKITDLAERPKWKRLPDAGADRIAALPIRFRTEYGATTTDSGVKRGHPCAVVETADGRDRAVVAADAVALSVAGTAAKPVLLYRQHGAVWAVPLRRTSAAAYEAHLKKRSESNARQIRIALLQYQMDYDDAFPPAMTPGGTPLMKAIDPYVKDNSLFRDPHTGEMAFTYLYTGQPDATGGVPLFAYKTSTGRCVVYLDSKEGTKTVWDGGGG